MAAALALVVGLPLLLAGPFYARIGAAAKGSPLAFVTSAAISPDLALMMSRQPPGERHWRDYVSVPTATFLAPRFDQPGMFESVPGLLYASTWADGHGQYVWLTDSALRLAPVLTIGGLVPTVLVGIGVLVMLRRRRPGELACLGFAGILLVSLLRYSWVLPHYSPLKASYLLAAMLPRPARSRARARGDPATSAAGPAGEPPRALPRRHALHDLWLVVDRVAAGREHGDERARHPGAARRRVTTDVRELASIFSGRGSATDRQNDPFCRPVALDL